MTNQQYKRARQIIRENGRYGLNFLSRLLGEKVYNEYYTYIFNIVDTTDKLKERQDVVRYCIREGYDYNFRQIQ